MSGPQCVYLYCTPLMVKVMSEILEDITATSPFDSLSRGAIDSMKKTLTKAEKVLDLGDTDYLVWEDRKEVREPANSKEWVSHPFRAGYYFVKFQDTADLGHPQPKLMVIRVYSISPTQFAFRHPAADVLVLSGTATWQQQCSNWQWQYIPYPEV